MASLIIPTVFLLMAIIIGLCGRNHRFGFWGLFFATMLFTPLMGILLLLAAGGSKSESAAQ